MSSPRAVRAQRDPQPASLGLSPSPLLPSLFGGAAPSSHPTLQSLPSTSFLAGNILSHSLVQKERRSERGAGKALLLCGGMAVLRP